MIEVRATDRAGNLLSPLPDVRPGDLTLELGRPGRIDLGLHVEHAREFGAVDNREVQVWRPGDTAPVFIGVPWSPSKSLGARSLSIPCEGLETYLMRRLVVADLSYTGLEQFQIGWNLIDHTQGQPGGGLNLSAATWTPSGVTRTRAYYAHDLPYVYELLDDFRGLIDGFDWAIIPTAADRREWTPYYPSRGTSHPEWAVGYGPGTRGNCHDYAMVHPRSRVTRRHYAAGSGQGPDRVIGSYAHPNLGQAGGPDLLESTSAESTSITDAATLNGYAQAQVEARSAVTTIVTEAVVTGPSDLVDDVRPGDTLPVRIDDGWVQVNATYRVTSCRWPPAWDRVTLSLQPLAGV